MLKLDIEKLTNEYWNKIDLVLERLSVHCDLLPDLTKLADVAESRLALFGVAVMRLVALAERLASRAPLPRPLLPMLGGALLIAVALYSPQKIRGVH